MDTVIIENVKYMSKPNPLNYDAPYLTYAVQATIDGIHMSVPLDPANRHYAEIMRQVEAGTLTIADAV